MSLGKTLSANYPMGPSSLPVAVVSPTKDSQTEPQKVVSSVGVAPYIRKTPGSYERKKELDVAIGVRTAKA